MAYFDNNIYHSAPAAGNLDDTNCYPFTPAVENFDAYQQWSSILAPETAGIQTLDNLTEYWDTVEQPSPTAGPSTDVSVPDDYDPAALATPYQTHADSFIQPLYAGRHSLEYQGHSQLDGYIQSNQHWPEASAQPQQANLSDWDAVFANRAALEMPILLPALGHSKNQGGASYPQDVYDTYQPSTGPARNELNQKRRFQPYGTHRARATEHTNAEAGPSSLVPPLVPFVGPPTMEPSGGKSERTADAGNNQPFTEENRAPSNVPRGRGKPRKNRAQFKGDAPKLFRWVQKRKGLYGRPSLKYALTVAVEVIQTVRQVIYQEPRLRGVKTEEAEAEEEQEMSEAARTERERRSAERNLYQELSRYYPRSRGLWTRTQLLMSVVQDMETHPSLRQTPDDLASGTSLR